MANTKMDSSCIKSNDDLSKSNKWYAKHKAERERIYQHTTEQFIRDIYADVQLSDQQRAQLRDLAKLHIGGDGKLESIADNPHITSNWGQYQENPKLFLGIVQICKLVGLAEMLEDGAEINTRYGQAYLEAHPKLEKAFARAGKLHLGLSLLLNITAIHTLATAEGAVHSFNGIATVITRLSDLGGDVTDVLDGWRNLPSMKKYTLGFKHWGSLAIGFSLVEGVAKNATALRSLFDEDSPLALRLMGSFQAGIGAAGGVSNAVAMKMIMDRVAAGQKAVTPGLRNALIIAALCELATMPLDIYSISMQSEYADKNDELDKKFKEYGYHGYGLLRDLYKDKVKLDAALLSLRTAVTAVHLSTSVALKSSGIGIPAALAIDAIAVAVSAVLDFVEQPILDKIAKAQLNKILEWEAANPGKNYFVNALDAHYAERLDHIAEMAIHTHNRWGVDHVIAITQMQSNDQIRELAMLVGRAEKLQDGKLYVDVFKDGAVLAEKSVKLDATTGIIDIIDNNLTQALVFTSPILVPGETITTVHNDGEKQYTFWEKLWQNLTWALAGPSASGPNKRLRDAYDNAGHYNQKHEITVSPTNWQINDKGTANTKFSFNNVIQRIKGRDGTVKKIDIKVNMGAGNDWVIAPVDGAVQADGGADYDVVSYVSSSVPIQVNTSANGDYTVERKLKNTKVFEEVVQMQQAHFGRNSTKVEYRAIEERIVNEDITDKLTGVEKIIGSEGDDNMLAEKANGPVHFDGRGGNDIIITGAGEDIIYGGKGNDTIKTRAGDDTIMQDDLEGEDYICGGDGDDTLDYSRITTDFGLEVDIRNETVKKKIMKVAPARKKPVVNAQNKPKTNGSDYMDYTSFDEILDLIDAIPTFSTKIDTVKNVENIIATNQSDRIKMDDRSNLVYGLDGDDSIDTFDGADIIFAGDGQDIIRAGDGNDMIDAGQGDDKIFAGAGDDFIQQTDDSGQDQIDGGAGSDTLDYSNILPDRHVIVDLLKGYAEKYIKKADRSTSFTKDEITNVEAIIGTKGRDQLYGDNQDNLLDGMEGNNMLQGRGGNDFLRGGKDKDTYKFSKGDGHDIVEDRGGNSDRIMFLSSLDNFIIHKKGNELVITSNADKDSVTVLNHFSNNHNKVEYIGWGNKRYNVDHLTNNAAILSGSGADSWSFNASQLLQPSGRLA